MELICYIIVDVTRCYFAMSGLPIAPGEYCGGCGLSRAGWEVLVRL